LKTWCKNTKVAKLYAIMDLYRGESFEEFNNERTIRSIFIRRLIDELNYQLIKNSKESDAKYR